MDPVQEFRRHADECRRMARETRDLESRASWTRLAERWVRCAELEEGRTASARQSPRHRRSQRPIYRHAS